MMSIKKKILVIVVAMTLLFTQGYAETVSNTVYDGLNMKYTSTFFGFESLVDRDYTGGYKAYDYSVHLIRTGEDTGNRHRAFIGGRWKSDVGDGDHILQWTAPYGAPNTWAMWYNRPEFWQGQEEGHPDSWFSGNVIEPEVICAPESGWIMYTQVGIGPGRPTDYNGGELAITRCDRIMLARGVGATNWVKEESRGVIVNIPDPLRTSFHHQEVIYVPWDVDGKKFWMYVYVDIDTNQDGILEGKGYKRIRSSDYTTFDYANIENTSGFSQLGNQIGYLYEAPGGPLFVRITFRWDGTRNVPVLQHSRNGLAWLFSDDTSVPWLEGSSDNLLNKNCYFLGIATWMGKGYLQYLGNNKWKAQYAATTSNSSSAPAIFDAEIGQGELIIEITP